MLFAYPVGFATLSRCVVKIVKFMTTSGVRHMFKFVKKAPFSIILQCPPYRFSFYYLAPKRNSCQFYESFAVFSFFNSEFAIELLDS